MAACGAPPVRNYPLVADQPQALAIVMPFTASLREVEALGPWDRRLAWLFTCDPLAHERAMEMGFHAILHRGATAASLQLGNDKPFVRDMLEALLAAAPGMAWYGIANCDIRLCPHAFSALCRANIYHRISVDEWDDPAGVPFFNGEDMFVMTEDVARQMLARVPHLLVGVPYWDSWVAAYLKIDHDAPRYYDRIYHKKHAMGYSLHSEEAAYNRRLLRNDPYWKHYWERREFFSHEALRQPGQLPVHYAAPGD